MRNARFYIKPEIRDLWMSSSYSVVQPSSLLVLVISTCIRGLETCIEMLLKQMRQINVRLRGQRFVTWRTSNESKSNQHPSNLNKIPMVSSFQLLFCRQKNQGNLGLRTVEVVKMLIPNSAASKIIGRDGCHAREMAAQTGCRTSISRRNPGVELLKPVKPTGKNPGVL